MVIFKDQNGILVNRILTAKDSSDMSLKNRFVAELEKSEDVELEPVIHFYGLEDSEMKRIFGKEYCDLVQVIQDLLNEVGTFNYPPQLTI